MSEIIEREKKKNPEHQQPKPISLWFGRMKEPNRAMLCLLIRVEIKPRERIRESKKNGRTELNKAEEEYKSKLGIAPFEVKGNKIL